MHNLMQDWPLRVTTIIDHAATYHANRPVIGRDHDGNIFTTTYSMIRRQSMRLRQALEGLGIGRGDVVGVMAWNTPRHMEIWYGVSGAGAVLHTLNPRLSTEQLDYIINHAQDQILMVDPDLLPILAPLMDRFSTVRHLIVMCRRDQMPETDLDVLCYEDLLAAEDGDANWVPGEETDACGICYTSGTTGSPKGVVYTHRSNVLHALSAATPDMLGLSSKDVIMPVVPLFHANGWSIGYTAPLTGASMVMPGRALTPPALHELLELGVTVTAAVPTIWMMLLQHMKADTSRRFSTLKRVVIGGSSCPRAVIETFQHDYGVQVLHAWGMTEMSPLGTVCSFKPEVEALEETGRLDVQETVGHPPYTVELDILSDDGTQQPRDGETQGRLVARGPAVVGEYLKASTPAHDTAGWFDTGDIATMDANGYVRITDRAKDVIKSGGEWISSIDLENAAVGHLGVAQAAAVGIPHPKWDERPILVVVAAPGQSPEKEAILATVAERFAKWQVPDDVIFMETLPLTATGKISKLTLREMLEDMDYKLPA